MISIGIVGTAKNTGKTTSLSYLMDGLRLRNKNLAFTSIGYDGEDIDNITNLPKPKLFFHTGDLLATSEKCLNINKNEYEIIEETPFDTALGNILLVRILKPCKVVLAGPNSGEGLKYVLNRFKELKIIDYFFVDGALNRLSPMYLVDKLIFTTGAAKNTNIQFLIDEMKIIEKIFSFDITKYQLPVSHEDKIRIISDDFTHHLKTSTLVDQEDFEIFSKSITKPFDKIYLEGLISINLLSKALENLLSKISNEFELIIKSPMNLLYGENYNQLIKFIETCEKNSIKISYKFKPQLIAITINPFYPAYKNFKYYPSYIDKNELLLQMKTSLKTPVYNILDEENKIIFDLLELSN